MKEDVNMAKPKDITGNKYGRLTVLCLDHRDKKVVNGKTLVYSYWKCQCECGNTCSVRLNQLTCERTTSCGCYQQECRGKANRTHGESGTSFYRRYRKIRERCFDKNNKSYNDYGGRGITCEWDTYEDFKNDMYESYLDAVRLYGDNTSIDRIDNNKNYCKENCRWVNSKIQNNNKRNVVKVMHEDGTFETFAEISERLSIKHKTLDSRYRHSKYKGTGKIPYNELMHEND